MTAVADRAADRAADREDVEVALAAGLSCHLGRAVRVAELSRVRMGTFSCHPISRLRVTLAGGGELPVVFKRLRAEHGKDPRREVLMYRHVLAGGRFGAPTVYATVCDDALQRHWLFLEDVGRWRLDWCAAEGWRPAFWWLARLHAAHLGRAERLPAAAGLADLGGGFVRGLADAARTSMVRHGTAAQVRRLDALTGRWLGWSIDVLERQPRTLLHGDCSCHNLLVERPGRIRPIDWEWAGVGPAAWDVAKLLAGWGRRRDAFLATYLDVLGRFSPGLVDRPRFAAAVEHATLAHQLWYLRWWIEPCHEPGHVDRLLDGMQRRWLRLAAGS